MAGFTWIHIEPPRNLFNYLRCLLTAIAGDGELSLTEAFNESGKARRRSSMPLEVLH